MDPEQAARVREAGQAAVEVIRAWGAPFCDGWEDWRPGPGLAGARTARGLGAYGRAADVLSATRGGDPGA